MKLHILKIIIVFIGGTILLLGLSHIYNDTLLMPQADIHKKVFTPSYFWLDENNASSTSYYCPNTEADFSAIKGVGAWMFTNEEARRTDLNESTTVTWKTPIVIQNRHQRKREMMSYGGRGKDLANSSAHSKRYSAYTQNSYGGTFFTVSKPELADVGRNPKKSPNQPPPPGPNPNEENMLSITDEVTCCLCLMCMYVIVIRKKKKR